MSLRRALPLVSAAGVSVALSAEQTTRGAEGSLISRNRGTVPRCLAVKLALLAEGAVISELFSAGASSLLSRENTGNLWDFRPLTKDAWP